MIEYNSNSKLSSDIEWHHTPTEPLDTGIEYIRQMDEVGWPLDGAFSTLLSSVGRSLRQETGRMRIWRDREDISRALAVLISDL